MSILIVVLIVIVLLAIAIYGVQQVEVTAPFRGLIICILCVIAIVVIASKAGLGL